MTDKQKDAYNQLCLCDAEQVLNLFIDWHGWQIFTDEFIEHCIEEGYVDGYYG